MDHFSAARRAASVLLMFCLTTCSGGCGNDDAQTLQQTRQSLHAWAETLRLVSDQWADQSVPKLYIVQILDAANKELDQQAKKLQSVRADQPQRAGLDQQLAEVRRRLNELHEAVNRSDTAAARAASNAMPADPPYVRGSSSKEPGEGGAAR